jgi:hypothetical protein
MEGVNSRMIYCENFCKCHSVLPAQQLKKKKKKNELILLNTFPFKICFRTTVFYYSENTFPNVFFFDYFFKKVILILLIAKIVLRTK